MMVMFAFATTACSKKTNDYVIMLKNHERALHINAAGKVTATDISLAQFFTMESITDALSDTFRIALYVKEVGRYLCFRKGKLVGMKHLVPDCHFIEKMDHGYFLYANAYKPEWRVGFTRGLKPVGPRHLQRPQTMRRACFLFVKINAEHFDRDMFTTTTTTTTTTTMSPLKKLIESRDQHSIRDYGLEEYERRLNSSRGRNYRTHSRTEPERRRGSTGGGAGGGGVGHRHRSPETRHRNVSNTPQPKNLRRPQPTQKAGEERRKKTQRENVRRVHTNGQRKRKQVDSHYDHSDLPPNSQSSRAGGGTSSSSSASSTASVTATSLAATVSLAPSALNLVAMLAASRRKRVKRKKLEEEQQEESETQANGGNAEKQRSANSDLQLVAHENGHESEQLYDLPAKKARKSQTPHDHSYHQKSSYAEHLHAEQMPVATTPEHFVQQPQNHKYSNSNAKKFHSHKRSNNSHHSRNSHRQQQLQEEGKERDEAEEEEAENPSHSLSSSGNNNKNNYLNENLSKLTKLKTNTNINLNLNTNINNNTNNLNANAILPALPKNFNNTDKQNSHNNQAKQYLNLMTDFKQLQTPTPALNVSQQPQHHRRQHHNNNGVKNSLRRHRHKRDLGFSLPQLSATSQMTRPQPRSNADELRGLVNKENELPAFHRRSSDVESLDNNKRVEYEGEHDNYDADADDDENGGDTINKSNRLLDNNNNNHKHLSEDNNFLQQQQQQQRPQPSGLPFNRLKYPNNVNRISSDDDDDDDDDVDVSSMKLQKPNIPNEHNIASHYLESDANYNPMKIRYNKANYLTAAATTTTKNNNNINITNNVNKPNASFSGVFSQLNVINNNYMRHQSRSRSSSSSSGSSVSAVKKTNVNNNITRHNVIIISNVLNNDDIDVSGSGAAATATETATAFQTRFVLGQKNMYRQLQQQKTQQQVIDNKFITNTNLKNNNNNNINVHYIYNHNEKKTKQNDVNDDDDDVYENFIKTENKYEKIIVQYRSVVQII